MTSWFRYTLFPLFLIISCPSSVFLIYYINNSLNGSVMRLFTMFGRKGIFYVLKTAWAPYIFGSTTAWKIFGIFSLIQLIFMRILPGKSYTGQLTSKGNLPRYKDNGLLAFILTILGFYLGAYYFKIFKPTIFYDNLPYLFGTFNLYGLIHCLILLCKGYWFPSSSDSGTTGMC